jgi:polyisoprenoid-binding protein YceI
MKKTVFVVVSFLMSVAVNAVAQPRAGELLKGESWIAYKLVHPLHEIVARSTSPDYSIEIDPTKKQIETVSAEVDVTSFDSGNSNRDSHAMEVVEALLYPDASFTSTSVDQKGDSLFVKGKLTFHGVTKSITMTGTDTWQPNRLDVHGAFTISLTEFKIDRPSLLMIPVEDNLSFSLAAAFTWK